MEPLDTMAQTNWKMVRDEYETLGTDVKELAKSHHTTESLIRHAIKEEGWERIDLNDADDTPARLKAMEIRHQTTLVPKFIALQTKMLAKCDELLDAVNGLEDAGSLRIVSEVIEKHRPAILGNQPDSGTDKSITVRILSKVGDGADVAVNAVEITTSAGSANGVGVPHGTPVN